MNMPVTYRVKHHDDKPCEREIVIPTGYERTHEWPTKTAMSGTLHLNADKDQWVEFDGWIPTAAGDIFIRPIAKPIELVAGGYYEFESGTVHQCQPSNSMNFPFAIWGIAYDRNGAPKFNASPRILRRVYLSDAPVGAGDTLIERLKGEASGELFRIKVEEAAGTASRLLEDVKALRKTIDEMPEGACKDMMLGMLMKYEQKPFLLSGAGWYRARDKSWIRMTGDFTESDHEGWFDDGRHASGDTDLDLVQRATDAQAAVLEAL